MATTTSESTTTSEAITTSEVTTTTEETEHQHIRGEYTYDNNSTCTEDGSFTLTVASGSQYVILEGVNLSGTQNIITAAFSASVILTGADNSVAVGLPFNDAVSNQ